MTDRSTRLKALDKQVVWHPFTQMRDWQREDPVIIERADGFYLVDVDGRRYIDGHSSLWVNLHGHGHPAIVEAIASQAAKLDHSTLLGLGNVASIELAEQLVQRTPGGLDRVFYSDSGSTAVEIALKMAYQYWQLQGRPDKNRFLTFSGAYHGDTVGSVSVGGIDLFHERFRGLLFDATQAPWPRPYHDSVNPDDPVAVRDRCLTEFEQLLDLHGDRLAAVVAESRVQGADGIHVAPAGFMPRLERLCRARDVLFIVDEVATGFCRTGQMFACDLEGVRPDLMAVAKGLTGGTLPLAATLASQEIHDAFEGEFGDLIHLFHGHTYTGNPIACAAALANLALIDQVDLCGQAATKAGLATRQLDGSSDHPHIGDIRQLGLMIGIEVVADRDSRQPYPVEQKVPQQITVEAARRGAIIRPLGNVLVLMPPPAIPEDLLVELIGITIDSIEDVIARQ